MPAFSISASSAAMILGLACAAASAAEGGRPPTLTFPDGTVLTLPHGTEVFGPIEHATPPAPVEPPSAPRVPPAADKAEAPASPGERRRQRLDDLFARLAGAKDATEASALTATIDRLWTQSDSPTADLLMARAAQTIAAKDNATAIRLLDAIVALRPGWAEAWNRRATLRYLDNDDAGSMADIGRVLALEPRHFGALSGMGYILHRNGEDKAALTVLRKAAEINPQQPDIKSLIEELAPEVEGHAL